MVCQFKQLSTNHNLWLNAKLTQSSQYYSIWKIFRQNFKQASSPLVSQIYIGSCHCFEWMCSLSAQKGSVSVIDPGLKMGLLPGGRRERENPRLLLLHGALQCQLQPSVAMQTVGDCAAHAQLDTQSRPGNKKVKINTGRTGESGLWWMWRVGMQK